MELEEKKHAERAKNDAGQGWDKELEITTSISNEDAGIYYNTLEGLGVWQ